MTRDMPRLGFPLLQGILPYRLRHFGGILQQSLPVTSYRVVPCLDVVHDTYNVEASL